MRSFENMTIDLEIVWATVENDIPSLLTQLETVRAAIDDSGT